MAQTRAPQRVHALFIGTPGVGKIVAARILNCRFRIDAVRVDPPAVVTKYIGETEKYLDRCRAQRPRQTRYLLFTEPGTLFGKRADSRDPCNRYTNGDVGYST